MLLNFYDAEIRSLSQGQLPPNYYLKTYISFVLKKIVF
ncbi:hypothetical protein AREALGSMS7_00247 [Arenibacter algicola]|uniref:Uncharacterized protein n=1 Tax=Arenibacter algicola TaxID=616991 RepID=A0A221UR06_9FLAO|nr:hypothetical protein AREALGSMS7_00247 [Arenibacter algicola]